MIRIEVCFGGVCFVKGSLEVLGGFREAINKNGVSDKVEAIARFCVGKCYTKFNGVNIRVDDMPYNVQVDEVEDFFNREILPLVK